MKAKKRIAALISAALLFQTMPVLAEDSAPLVQAGVTENAVPLSSDLIQYKSMGKNCKQIPCESLNGIYFLTDSTLSFYSPDTNSSSVVYTFGSYQDCYTTDNKIYMLSYSSAVTVYDLNTQTVETTFSFEQSASAIGADSSGRIYLAGSSDGQNMIYLLSSEGTLLSQTPSEEHIYSFGGFDDSNGNFYVEAYDNWVYWGYDHDMHALKAGNVSENALSFSEDILMYVCQSYFYERQDQVDVLGGRYLCVDSTFSSGLSIWDSNSYDPKNPADEEVLFLAHEDNDSSDFQQNDCVGTRTVYRNASHSVVTFKNNSSIAEYDLATGNEISLAQTEYPAFSLFEYKGGIAVIEKSGDNFFYEYFPWIAATDLQIIGESSQLNTGAYMQLTTKTDGSLTDNFTWSSSNPRIASVSQSGEVFGWHEGDAVVTVRTGNGLSADYPVHVTKDNASAVPENNQTVTSGAASNNHSANNYSTWSRPVNSYITENTDGTFTRIEYCNNTVLAESFSSDGKLLNSQTLPAELDIFGGFFSGSAYNYFVFGQENPSQSDDVEVMRVVRYSKDYQRIDSVSVNGANTYIPFDAGSLRMAENGTTLYIHTCHEMYDDGDGVHHQANMTFVINESDMSVAQSYYDVMNIAQAGYVSHSFNQFVRADGKYIYRVDHGDANPRAISITRCKADDRITNVTYTLPVSLSNVTGYNPTGASVGGFELSSDSCIIAGNSVDYTQENADYNGQRNIFVSITDHDLQNSKTIWLTDYDETQPVDVYTPHLVKIGKDQFLVLWEERETENRTLCTKAATIDGNGNLTSDTATLQTPLSDCVPVMCKDGLVRWYTTQNNSPTLYALNPLNLSEQKADDPDPDPTDPDPTDPDPEPPARSFTDVDRETGNWYYDAVYYNYDRKIMNGVNPTHFEPLSNLARAQFAIILHNMEGKPDVTYEPKFADVADEQWYTDAILWASSKGIVTGYTDGSNNFGWGDNILREQMAVMMYRYAKNFKQYNVSDSADFDNFTDAAKVSDYAKEAMKWAVGNGIITGKDNGVRLDPQGNASRAECAIIIQRFLEKYEK